MLLLLLLVFVAFPRAFEAREEEHENDADRHARAENGTEFSQIVRRPFESVSVFRPPETERVSEYVGVRVTLRRAR